jgi:hypothetical protein
MRTEAQIAAFEAATGVKRARGGRADALRQISDKAFELIKVIELEYSGIRDGDGHWYGSDVVGAVMGDLQRAMQALDEIDRPNFRSSFLDQPARVRGDRGGVEPPSF